MNKVVLKSVLLYLIFAYMLSLAGCKDEFENKLIFNYKIATSGVQFIGDTIVINKETDLKFNFTGNYDFLSFYSGEPGHEYAKRNVKVIPKDDISTSVLSFSAMPQYGIIAGTLRVFISETFEGLQLFDKKRDSIMIASHDWIEITDLCNLPVTSSQVLQTSIPMIDYCDKNISLAFLYKTDQNTSAQPTWEIRDLKIINTLKNDSVIVIKAFDLGFTALDMYNLSGVQTGQNGIWALGVIASPSNPLMRIQSSPSGAAMNEDWLISTPSKINSRLPDTASAISDILAYTKEFTHQYNTAGVYNITLVAQKVNFDSNVEVTKSMVVKIID
jgi:hypothetical protein